MDYLKSWKNWEDRINKLEKFFNSEDGINKLERILNSEETIQNEKKKFKDACLKVVEISKNLEISIDEVKSIFHYNSCVIQEEIKDFPQKLKHYQKLFEKYFFYIIGQEYFGKSFLTKTIAEVEERINILHNLFNTSHKNVIRMIAYSANYLGYTLKTYEQRIKEWETYLNTTRETVLENFVIYPAMINISMGLTQSRLDRISKNIEKDIKKIKEMYKKYPHSLEFTPSTIDYALRFNHNRVDLIYKQIKEYPWVLDCVSRVKGHEYCGLSSLHNLFKLAEFIEENFGYVKHVIKDNFDENNNDVTFLITKKQNNKYFIISLGFLLPEDKILNNIFQQNKVIARYQRINIDNIHNLAIYKYNSYFAGYRLGSKPSEEELSIKYFEMPPADITGEINKPLVLKLSENEKIEIVHTLKLVDSFAEKYIQFNNNKEIDFQIFLNFDHDETDKDSLNFKNKVEINRKNFIENIFGSVEQYINFLKKET